MSKSNFSISLHQPYFFPYYGYFQLIKQSDLFIAFDTVQWIKGGWINRNKIKSGYITVPVKGHRSRKKIKDVKIAGKWKPHFFGKLQDYRKVRNFDKITKLISECVLPDFQYISELSIYSLQKVCEYLGIRTPIVPMSKLRLKLGKIEGPGDWALRVSEALGADEYINLPGGKKLFDKRKWRKIKLTFLETHPDLSIIHNLYEGTFPRQSAFS